MVVLLLSALPPFRLSAQGGGGAVRVAGYLQPRFQAVGDSALFFLRRGRLGADAAAAPWARVRVQVELRNLGENGTAAQVVGTDLFVALTHRHFAFTAGQAKVPFSLEAILGASTLPLADRSIIVGDNAPNRDVGAQFEWRPARALDLQGGVFDGEGPNHASNPDKKMAYIGRAVLEPVPALELSGAAAAYPDSTWYDAAAVARRGPWLVRAEWLRRALSRTSDKMSGWYVLGSWMAVANRVQLVGRVERFDPTSASLDRETGYTAGVQYLFRGDDLKVQASYARFSEQGPAVANDRLIVQLQARW